jgi:hypothetical protein
MSARAINAISLTNMLQNVANEYAYMLLAQGLSSFFARKHDFPSLSHLLEFKVPIVLTQLMARILQSQAVDGSWRNGSHEITAYCILALIPLNTITLSLDLKDRMIVAINTGRNFLRAAKGKYKSDPIWIEKVRYHSLLLTEVYCTTALLAPAAPAPTSTVQSQPSVPGLHRLFSALPLFSSLSDPELVLKTALAESQAFLPHLRSTQADIFPRLKSSKKNKYMEIIPFAWTACNSLRNTPLPAEVLFDMMSVSLLNFQADEYFELITTKENAAFLHLVVDEACALGTEPQDDLSGRTPPKSDVATPPEQDQIQPTESSWSGASAIVQKYADQILQHSATLSAPAKVQFDIRNKLAGYMHAQITSVVSRSPNPRDRTERHNNSLFDWVRTLGAEDTSCPYSFVFYMALVPFVTEEKPNDDTSREYILKALCGHLATMCRIYNDYGSLVRDSEEGNLNCVDFFSTDSVNVHAPNTTGTGDKRQAEETMEKACSKRAKTGDGSINCSAMVNDGKHGSVAKIKGELMELAQFERQCMEIALSQLKKTGLKGKILEALLLFIDVTDLFGQIYVVRDIGTRTK